MNSDSDRKYINQMRKAINQSGGMITVSDYIKTRVLSIGGLNQEKVKTLYNATDIDMFSKKISNSEQIFLKNQLGIAENSIVILYSGRMCDEKGVLELIKAFVEVIEKNNDAVLLLVGSVSYGETTSDEYTKTIAAHMAKYPQKIIETGFVDYRDMYKYYSIADIQVIPSKWDEPFGLVAIEGMAQGLPIISTNSGGLVEILNKEYAMVINRENEICELKRAMLWLVENREKRLELGQNAKDELKKHNEFSYKEYYNRFLEIID
ncbi:MAG: glycosyltransferase family 4 protein [Eubacterium sp.]